MLIQWKLYCAFCLWIFSWVSDVRQTCSPHEQQWQPLPVSHLVMEVDHWYTYNHAKILKCFDSLHQIWFWLLIYFRSLTWSSSTLATWCKELPRSLQKTLMLGKTEGKRRRGWQRMRWLDGITDLMGMSLGGLREMTWLSQTWLSNWKTTNVTYVNVIVWGTKRLREPECVKVKGKHHYISN